jgi:hypothetical protein
MHTEQQQLHLALLTLFVVADVLLNRFIAPTLRVRWFLAEAHYARGHEQKRGAGAKALGEWSEEMGRGSVIGELDMH